MSDRVTALTADLISDLKAKAKERQERTPRTAEHVA